jgi:hypothetical protein
VRVAREALQVGHAEVADPGGETFAEREGGERREPAGAATLDREPVRVDVAALDEEPGGRDVSSTSTMPHCPSSSRRTSRP